MSDLNVMEGRAWVCGDYTDCYQILPSQYWSGGDKVGSLDPGQLSRHIMEDLDPDFARDAAAGKYSFIVGGKNFGGGRQEYRAPCNRHKGPGAEGGHRRQLLPLFLQKLHQ